MVLLHYGHRLAFGLVVLQLSVVHSNQALTPETLSNSSSLTNSTAAPVENFTVGVSAAIFIGCIVALYDLAFCFTLMYAAYYYYQCRHSHTGQRSMDDR